jgi:hypothetical protein
LILFKVETKRENSRIVLDLESRLNAKLDSFSKLETENEILTQDRDVLRSRLDTLIARLNDAKAETAQVEEAFRQEIQAQTNLAEIHKSKKNKNFQFSINSFCCLP